MASIELSAGWMAPMYNRIIRSSDVNINCDALGAYASGLLPGGDTPGGYGASNFRGTMCLMKGAIPATPTLSNYNARASDMLVRFRNTASIPWSTYSVVNTNPAVLTSQFVAASAAGTATWFWWFVNKAASSLIENEDNSYMYQQVIGTVGLAGSGSDLEMVNNVLVAGELYRIANLKIQFPSIWTY